MSTTTETSQSEEESDHAEDTSISSGIVFKEEGDVKTEDESLYPGLSPEAVQQLERRHKWEVRAWWLYDGASSPFPNSGLIAFMGPFLTILAQTASSAEDDWRIAPLGFKFSTESYYLFCTFISIFLQLISFVVLGGLADYGSYRKMMFCWTNIVCPIFLVCYFFVVPSVYGLAGGLFIITNVLFGLGNIYYNSFLPYLTREEPHFRRKALKIMQSTELSEKDRQTQLTIAYSQRMNRISAYGVVIGFIVSVIMLVFHIAVLAALPDSCRPKCVGCPDDITHCDENCPADWDPTSCDEDHVGYRIVFGSIGLVWLLLIIPIIIGLRNRKGLALPEGAHYWGISTTATIENLKEIRKLPETFKFLVAFWIFSDGQAALGAGASLIAFELLEMNATELGIAVLEGLFAGIFGNLLFLWMNRKFAFWTPKRILMLMLLSICVIPFWTLFISTKAEFYVAAGLFGLNNASITSFSRSLLATLLPKGLEARFYSLFELTDKGTSWVSPLVIGVIISASGNIRTGIVTVLIFLFLGTFLLFFVNPQKGKEDAEKYDALQGTLAAQAKEILDVPLAVTKSVL